MNIETQMSMHDYLEESINETKRILLIDADSTIPNIALMKLSTHYKKKGYAITLKCLQIPFYPTKRKKVHTFECAEYENVYCSIIFETNKKYIKGQNIIFGGTGYDYSVNLPVEIDRENADYSIYPENTDTQVFLTRGCIRKCYFCFVPKKEGRTFLYKNLGEIIKEYKGNQDEYNHKRIRFFDNNILSYEKHKDVFKTLIQKKIKTNFNEGLDFRLLDLENTELLKQLKQSSYIFAFDDINYIKMLESKKKLLQILNEYKYKVILYIYINDKMKIEDTVDRIKYCKDNKYLPYVMRDKNVYASKHKNFYTDLASYCNQPNIFKKMNFKTFLLKRYTNEKRIKESYLKFKKEKGNEDD